MGGTLSHAALDAQLAFVTVVLAVCLLPAAKRLYEMLRSWRQRSRDNAAEAHDAQRELEALLASGRGQEQTEEGDQRLALDRELRGEAKRVREEERERELFSLRTVRRVPLDQSVLEEALARSRAAPPVAPSAVEATRETEPVRFSLASVRRVHLDAAAIAGALGLSNGDAAASPLVFRPVPRRDPPERRPVPQPAIETPAAAERRIRFEQDEAFARSLAEDQGRADRAAEDARRAAAFEAYAAFSEKSLVDLTAPAVDQAPPVDGATPCRIMVRAHGGRHQRQFWSSDGVAALRWFVIASVRPEWHAWKVVDGVHREVALVFRRSEAEATMEREQRGDLGPTLESAGLCPSATLFLAEADDDAAETVEPGDANVQGMPSQ